jgi:ribosomal protein L40E
MPFYIKIGNLLTSIVGIGAIAVTVISGVTVIGAATGIGNTIGAANFINGVGGSAKALGSIPNALRFSPTDQMPSLIKSTDVSKATLKRCFESGLKQWDGKICPNCKSKWPLRERACKKCGTTRKVATKLFGEKVSKLTVKSFKPIKKTTVGLSLKALERLLSISTPAAHCVLKTLVDVGMVRAKISPWFVTKKLIVNGMKILATILVMLQVTGLKVVGINLIILTVVLGAAVSSVVGFTADKSLTKMKEKMK